MTQLEVSNKRFFGGPAPWYPRGSKKENQRREWVEGRQTNATLNPGEETTTFVCTDGDDARVIQAATNYQGTMLWRVQLRRGLVPVRNKEVSATAVVGVEFTSKHPLL